MNAPSESVVKIVKGTGLVFMTSLVALAVGFGGRLVVARYGLQSDYGVYSLALVIVGLCAVVAALGLPGGTSRCIAYAAAKADHERVEALVAASVRLGLISGFSFGALLWLSADVIASKVFGNGALGLPLKVLAPGIPLSVLMALLMSLFQGFGNVKPSAYFQNVLRPLLYLLALAPVAFLGLSFSYVYYGWLAALLISCIAVIVYTTRHLPLPSLSYIVIRRSLLTKQLLLFSLPLLAQALLIFVIYWTDTLMLGSLRGTLDVALYNAAHPLAEFISNPLAAMGTIYLPVTSALYAQESMLEIRRNFSTLTKWLCAVTLPLFLVLFLFPEAVLVLLFGQNYLPAAAALRILSLGYIVNNLMGPNGATLVAMGQVQFVMWTSLATAFLNVSLNILLIPLLGIEGAAIASAASLVSINMAVGWKLYRLAKTQPFSKNMLKPAVLSVALAFLFQFIFRRVVTVTPWMLPFLFILYYGIYGLAILITRSFDKEDIAVLLAIERRAGVNLSLAKSILRRFV